MIRFVFWVWLPVNATGRMTGTNVVNEGGSVKRLGRPMVCLQSELQSQPATPI